MAGLMYLKKLTLVKPLVHASVLFVIILDFSEYYVMVFMI